VEAIVQADDDHLNVGGMGDAAERAWSSNITGSGRSAVHDVTSVAPIGAPPEIVALLQKQIAEIVQLPDFKATLDKLSFQPVGSTATQFSDQIKNDIVVWSKVMKDANIPVN
jgi:tripartite-type tricarboxylate transporter receptor subunit TctC